MSDKNDSVLKTSDGAIWVVPEGPNHDPKYVACTDVDDVTDPQGDVELLKCFDVWGKWKTVGEKVSAPGAVTTTLTQLTFATRSYLQRVRGMFGLVLTERDGGRADEIGNWVRALILSNCRITSKKYAALVHHVDTNETTEALDISAYPPVIEVVRVTGERVTTTEVDDFNDVAFLPSEDGILPVKYGMAVSAGHTAVKGMIWLTDDGGASWTNTAAQPFADDEDIMACAIVDMGNGARRLIVGLLAPAGGQGETAYSDDDGATWHVVNLGGATAGLGATHGGAIFALDEHHIWLAGAAGSIDFSDDAGETWTAQESGSITAGAYTQVRMSTDGLVGYAVAAAGKVAVTMDGLNWNAATDVTGTPALDSVALKADGTVWVGTATGLLFFSDDDGDTWTQRAGWIGSGAGSVQSIGFANDYVGFMLVDTATPIGKILRTIDGGYNWKVVPADTNAGGTSLWVGDENYAIYTGLAVGGFGFLAVLVE